MNFIKLFSLISFATTFCTINLNGASDNKIILLISPPRSLSTAFLRMMQARGDFEVMNEPLLKLFHQKKIAADLSDWYYDNRFETYKALQNYIFETVKTKSIFIKEMAFNIACNIDEFKALVQHPQVHVVFLMRNPADVIISMYLKHLESGHDNNLSHFKELINYESFLQIMQIAQQNSVNLTHFIRAKDLYTKTEATIEAFCEATKIPYLPKSLSWHNLGDTFDINTAWHEIKKPDFQSPTCMTKIPMIIQHLSK